MKLALSLTLSHLALAAAILLAGYQLPFFYNANPEWVKSMASIAVLREFRNCDLVSTEAAPIPASRDQMAVIIRMKESKDTAAEGLLAKEVINYALRLKTLSQCIELEPGCLKIREKKVLQTVSTKTSI